MKKSVLRSSLHTARKGAVVTTAALALVLAGCSSSSDEGSSDSASSGSADGADGRGPITFAMGKNDTDKISRSSRSGTRSTLTRRSPSRSS